jgi:hypothetical protein
MPRRIADNQSGIKGRLVLIISFQTTIAAAGTNERLFPKCRVLVRPIKCVQSDHPVNPIGFPFVSLAQFKKAKVSYYNYPENRRYGTRSNF